ncbi:MAG: DUF4403 family protein [Rhodopseudomonas palustris]|nr:DUF4403 family protein [Rhodopseudomonas palustris]
MPADQNGVHISVPIDTPFTEIDRMLEAQLANKTLPGRRAAARSR